MERPNLLVLLTDQQHWRMLSCAGNPWLRTPTMDSLAAEGVRFERAYCTNPVCLPSRFSLLTGRLPSEVGVRYDGQDLRQPISPNILGRALGWLLREAGYETVYAGKLHGIRYGVEDVGFTDLTRDERGECARQCAQWLRRRRSNQPFCLVVSLINPHDICYMALREEPAADERAWIERDRPAIEALDQALQRPAGVDEETFFRDWCPPLPDNHLPQADEPEALGWLLDDRPFRRRAREQWSERRWREHRWAYARLTEVVDAELGEVVMALRETGLDETTAVVFTSDHGDHDGSHKLEHKTAFYEEAARVPLIVRPPGGCPARVEPTLVSNGLDLLPTLCDWAGTPPPASLTGRSFRPLLEGRRESRPWLPLENKIGRAIVGPRFKYVLHDGGARAEQLYDLERDPGETANHLDRPEHAAILAEMRRLLADQWPVWPPD